MCNAHCVYIIINCIYKHINTDCKLSIETVKEEPNNDVPTVIINNGDSKRNKFLFCLSQRSALWKNSTGPQFTIYQLQEALLYISNSKWISEEKRCLHLQSCSSSGIKFSEGDKYASKDHHSPSDVHGNSLSNFNDAPGKDINEESGWKN